jgi:hypothetical protein
MCCDPPGSHFVFVSDRWVEVFSAMDAIIGIPLPPHVVQSYIDWWKLQGELMENENKEWWAYYKKTGERLENKDKAMKKEFTDSELEAMIE